MRRNLLLATVLILATAAPSWSQRRMAQPRGGDSGGGRQAQGAPASRGGEQRGGIGGGGDRRGGIGGGGDRRGSMGGGGERRGGVAGSGPGAGDANARGGERRGFGESGGRDNQAREPRRAVPSDGGERRGAAQLPRQDGSTFSRSQRQPPSDLNQWRAGSGLRYAVPRNGEVRQEPRRYDLPDRRGNVRRYDSSDRRPGDRRVYNNNFFYVAPGRSYPYRPPRVQFYYYSPYPRYRYADRLFGWYGGVSGYGGYGFGYPTGELHLEVQPQWAQVYVDGYYAGTVDDFDGFGQGLRLEEGPYTIEIVAPGFEPLRFDVRIERGRQITYEGDLIPEGGPEPPFEPQP